mmetsp:Transcript_5903/g.25064  ORF Transcript_5903/g.25064 Transcript_5903/m.25064 type:complete len:213 (+) Transcript_5903:222-860(+)
MAARRASRVRAGLLCGNHLRHARPGGRRARREADAGGGGDLRWKAAQESARRGAQLPVPQVRRHHGRRLAGRRQEAPSRRRAREAARRRRAGGAQARGSDPACAGGHRGDHVHLGHHRRAQGRGAVAQQRVRDYGGPQIRRQLHQQGRVPGVPAARAHHGDGCGDGDARHRRGDWLRLAADLDGHRAEARRGHARGRAHAQADVHGVRARRA